MNPKDNQTRDTSDPLVAQRRHWRRPWRTTAILTIRGRRYAFDRIIEAEDSNGRSTLLCLSDEDAAAIIEFFPLKRSLTRAQVTSRGVV